MYERIAPLNLKNKITNEISAQFDPHVLIYILIIDYDTLGLEHWPRRLVFYNLIIV